MSQLDEFNHVRLLFPSNYVSHVDLKGKPVRVVIERINPREELQQTNGKKAQKPVVYLRAASKPWIINKTNANRIAQVYGPRPVDWLGKPIVIFPDPTVKFGRTTTGGIRVDVEATRKESAR